jgi:hypothetical protein
MLISYLSYFLGGCFLTNSIPHFVNGVSGRKFQSPFAKPPGKGLSTSTQNIMWGMINLVAAYLLLFQVGDFIVKALSHALALGLGIFLAGLFLARYFGTFHGGNTP